MNEPPSAELLAQAAAVLGAIRTPKKDKSCKSNAAKAHRPRKFDAPPVEYQPGQKPGFDKTKAFLASFPHALKSNEYGVKWPVQHRDGKTYNPDFWCESLNCFIELVTSAGNYSSQRHKWRAAIQLGNPLRVYWWKGQEITQDLINGVWPDCVLFERRSKAKENNQRKKENLNLKLSVDIANPLGVM